MTSKVVCKVEVWGVILKEGSIVRVQYRRKRYVRGISRGEVIKKKTIRESGMFRENTVNRNDPRGYYSRKYGNFPQNEFFPSDALNTL